MKSPLRWIGGKVYVIKNILPLLPEHHTYIEVHAGGAALLFAKKPSAVEVYNDIDGDIVAFFRLLRDDKKFAEFHKRVSLMPYSREEFNYCRKTWQECEGRPGRCS